MDILIAIVYVILFIILMVFVFSIGMLKPFMPKKEIALVLVVAFLIGSIGGAFFLEPLYEEVPAFVGELEKNVPGNEETLYLDLSSATDVGELEQNLLEPGYTSSSALQAFSDWYKLVYGDSIAYAQIHAKLVVSSASLGEFEDALLERGIVATHIEGPTQKVVNQTNQSMISDNEFILVSGVVGVMVSVVGIYFDAVVVSYRKFKKFLNKKVKR